MCKDQLDEKWSEETFNERLGLANTKMRWIEIYRIFSYVLTLCNTAMLDALSVNVLHCICV